MKAKITNRFQYCKIFPTLMPVILFLLSCGNFNKKEESISLITNETQQDSIFYKLIELTSRTISTNDSLAFLILPLQVSCPSCRNKTIDSIVKHEADLPAFHYIIVSASGGRKIINSYFLDRDSDLPVIENKLFIDSTHRALKYDLFKDNPVIYYTAYRKAYKKVHTIPATIRSDLREFFSGLTNPIQVTQKD